MADAANSIGDILADAVVADTIRESRKKASAAHPWGRGGSIIRSILFLFDI